VSTPAREQILAAYQRHSERRSTFDWVGLAECFAEDARYFDPMFGWQEGRSAISAFLEGAMAGLATRIFTDLWHVTEGDRLVLYWQCSTPGTEDETGEASLYHGMSALRLGTDGLWSEQMDIYDREQARSSRSEARLPSSTT